MILSIISFLVVLSILVLVHEAGHYFVARRMGVWVEEFGFGLPPKLLSKKIGETIYSLNALPFGGFVRLHGENSEEGVSKPTRAFVNKGKLQRAAIIVAGVIMNFVLGIAAFSLVYTITGIPKESADAKIADIEADSPAHDGGLIVGDIVKSVDGKEVKSTGDFVKYIDEKKGQKTVLLVQREVGGKVSDLKLTVTPRANPPAGQGPLGVAITPSTIDTYYPPLWQRPFYGMYYGGKEAIFWGKTVIGGFIQIFTDLMGRKVPQGVSGPVGIFAVTSAVSKFGILPLINFMGILSINLGIINILPFPALDGGRLLFIGIESLLGKKVIPKVEGWIHMAGMVVLLGLLAILTLHDIQGLISAGSISEFIKNTIK